MCRVQDGEAGWIRWFMGADKTVYGYAWDKGERLGTLWTPAETICERSSTAGGSTR